MAGNNNSKKKLNYTLLFIAKLLNSNNISKWFIAYGTLLGIVRENSCIDNDDDVDIICDCNDFNKLIKILNKNNIEIENCFKDIRNKISVIKTKETKFLASIDLYMGEIDKNGNYYEPHERITWQECYLNNKLIKKVWNDTILYLPNNAVKKLVGRYGKNWKIPCEHKKFWVIEGLPKNKII
tara:strand:- start:5504 stop:6049 length:546 start_codon:yes stop_codon:yes gene_type:complete